MSYRGVRLSGSAWVGKVSRRPSWRPVDASVEIASGICKRDLIGENSPNMREGPLDFEGPSDNLAERAKKPCLIHQFSARDLFDLARSASRPGHHSLEGLEEDYRPSLVDLHVAGVVGVHEDERDAG